MVDAVHDLEVLRIAVGLTLRGNALDTFAAGAVFLELMLAVVVQALLLQRGFDIDGTFSHFFGGLLFFGGDPTRPQSKAV